MPDFSIGREYARELEAETPATRKCLERISEQLYEWQPHPRSMKLGYLTLLVAEMPKWIADTITISAIDLATYQHVQPKSTGEMVSHFDENIKAAIDALQKVTNEDLDGMFYLKNAGQVLFSSTKKESVSSSINHWVHHRGQLTVYMRLNDIAVPSIYGPSADERTF